MATFTGFVRFPNPGFPDSIEEIDVEAHDLDKARVAIQKELDENYQPGGVIAHIERRLGFFQ